MRLLTTQKNELYRLLEQYGFDGRDFHYKEKKARAGKTEIVISYNWQRDFSFTLSFRHNAAFKVISSPFTGTYHATYCCPEWQGVVQVFDQWLLCVKQEDMQPDLWRQRRRSVLSAFVSQLSRLRQHRRIPAPLRHG